MNQSLVICPLPLERKYLKQSLEELSPLSSSCVSHTLEANGSKSLRVDYFPELGVFLAEGGHGKTQFALQTQFLLQQIAQESTQKSIQEKFKVTIEEPIQVNSVMCIGCSGALSESVNLFDVVVGEYTVEHDYNLKFIAKSAPRWEADCELFQRWRSVKATNLQIHYGGIASGDEDIVSRQRAAEIYEQTGALAVAWEGAGGARACALQGVPYIEIRGVTDLADDKTIENFKSNLRHAMENVAKTLLEFLK